MLAPFVFVGLDMILRWLAISCWITGKGFLRGSCGLYAALKPCRYQGIKKGVAAAQARSG